MTKQYFQTILFLLFCHVLPLTVTAQTVNIPDANLRAVVEKALGKASGATITASDMAELTSLDARHANISNLTGLEGATKLTWLNLSYNYISDISAVSGLTNLASIKIYKTKKSDNKAV
ncbi:leucine-rich repeat domain-containing protein [Candidatus Poribacteria bacterium]|nr:leucine-rich repeat domain-containing protein [Candidatus Poribacteria bacterium]